MEARRKAKEELEKARIEKNAILGEEGNNYQGLEEASKRQADYNKQKETTSKKEGNQQTAPPLKSGGMEQDWMNMLLASPLFQQINELEQALDKNTGAAANYVKGGDYSQAYIDVKDAQWTCGGKLKTTDVNNVSPAHFVLYRFGVFIVKLLNHTIQTPQVTLMLASNLPKNNYDQNCFRNSFFYERSNNILYVRKERLESVGDFVLLLVHALSHIHCDDLVSDSNPLFLRTFYRGLRVVCQDMFFSRSKTSETSLRTLAPNGPGGRAALEHAFNINNIAPLKVNVTEELIDQRIIEGSNSTDLEKEADLLKMKMLIKSPNADPITNVVEAKMAALKGQEPPQILSKPDVKKSSQQINTSAEFLQSQITDLQSKIDIVNEQIAEVRIKTTDKLRNV